MNALSAFSASLLERPLRSCIASTNSALFKTASECCACIPRIRTYFTCKVKHRSSRDARSRDAQSALARGIADARVRRRDALRAHDARVRTRTRALELDSRSVTLCTYPNALVTTRARVITSAIVDTPYPQ